MQIIDLKNFIRSGGYAWLGGYPCALLMSDGESIDSQSARENYRLIRDSMRSNDRRSGLYPEAVFIHYEGESIVCANSGRLIESAYGDDE